MTTIKVEAAAAVVDSYAPSVLFDPTSALVGYISDDSGPRGKFALADLAQCKYGHQKIEWVPWQNGHTAAKVFDCAYFSYEVYECLPQFDILYNHDLSSLTADIRGDDERLESMSCAMVVADGSCDEPRDSFFFVGTTTEDESIVEDSYDADELDRKVMLVHDYDGNVIGCGTIRPV